MTPTTRISRGKCLGALASLAGAVLWLVPGCLQPGEFENEDRYRLNRPDAELPEPGVDAGADSGDPEDAPPVVPDASNDAPIEDTNQPIPDSAPRDNNQPPTGQTLWIEAESASGLSAPMNIVDDATAAGGKHISADNAALNATPDTTTDGIASYMFTVDAMATFKIFGRVRAPSMDNDSFWVKMDDGPWIQWNNLMSSTDWVWDDVHDSEMMDTTVTFMLSQGMHTFAVTYRESGTALDKLVITSDPNLMPTGMGQ